MNLDTLEKEPMLIKSETELEDNESELVEFLDEMKT